MELGHHEHVLFCLNPQGGQDFRQQGTVIQIPPSPRASVRSMSLPGGVSSRIPTHHHWLGEGGASPDSPISSTGGEFS